ncbi:MAG TPA: DUF541 domain-containing protein [Campylobacterales bacterium]|nr:DUF541 domain-containing protein [Campylobacterales bacterium]
MKKILLSGLVVSGLFGFEIKMSHEFSSSLNPTKLAVNVNIMSVQKTSTDVLNTLTIFSDFIKSYKDLSVKGGNFHTSANYKYINNKRVKIGYKGSIAYNIKSSSSEKLTSFITSLSAKSEASKDIDISISSSSWQVDKADILKSKDDLKMKAIKWATNYKEDLSAKLGLECSIKSIDFNKFNYSNPPIIYEARAMDKSSNSMPVPQKDSRDMKINPRFEFECK